VFLLADGSPKSMVLLTDGTPNPLLRSLEAMYPESSRVGSAYSRKG